VTQDSISRRSYLGAAGLVFGTGLAGCLDSNGTADAANPEAFDVDATFDLSGDGPGEPVTVSLVVDDNEFERTFEPGEEFEAELESHHGNADIEVEYEEKVDVELEWSIDGFEIDIEIEQTRWEHTTGTVEISFENDELTTAFDGTITLPDATTEISGTDTRTVQTDREYEIDISLTTEEDEVEGELEIEWDDDDADDLDADDTDDDEDDDDTDSDDDD